MDPGNQSRTPEPQLGEILSEIGHFAATNELGKVWIKNHTFVLKSFKSAKRTFWNASKDHLYCQF